MPAIGATTQYSDIAQARGEQFGGGTCRAAVGLAHQNDGLPTRGEIVGAAGQITKRHVDRAGGDQVAR